MFGFAWYRFRATFKHRWGGLLAVTLLAGMLGGLSMGAVAAARSTESSFTDFAGGTHTPQFGILDGYYDPAIGLNSGYNPALLRDIARLPHVEKVESEVGLNMGPIGKNDEPLPASAGIGAEGSVDGLDFSEDRVVVTQGRLANPADPDEVVMDSATARTFGYHLGETVTMGWFPNTEAASSNFKVPRKQEFRAKLVGIGASQASVMFQDQDGVGSSQIELFTPALTRRLLQCCTNDMESGLVLAGGSRYQSAVETEIRHVLPKGLPFTFFQLSDVAARADRTLRPEAIALGVFGGIAGLATLLIAGQAIGRKIRLQADELTVLRSLGATPAMTMSDSLIGILGAVLAGAVLAGLVAIALSPLAPLGPVRPYLPVGVHVDWAVVGLGMAVLLAILGSLAAVLAYRAEPHVAVTRLEGVRGSHSAGAAIAAGLPPTAVTGIRFALEPGAGRTAVPVRSALLGTILAMVVVVATVTFGASLSTLVSHPALYGWNWSDDIDGGGGLGDVPAPAAAKLLAADHFVAGWTGVYFSTLQIDGLNLPVMGSSPHAAVGPALLSGHAFDRSDEVVLGPQTLAQLRKRVGDTVEVHSAGSSTTRLTIVGTATMPAIGVVGSSHLEMGEGALLSYKLIPRNERNVFDVPIPGPNAILVRFAKNADPAAAQASLQPIARNPQMKSDGGSVLTVQRPAEILNYGSLGSTPALLGVALAAGAAVALGLTLVASVRRRRHELALLKTLGFTRRQLALAIAWQATIAVGIGCLIGIPLGIALGRFLWDVFARGISAVPDPVIPGMPILLIAVAAIVLANVVAALPGRIAARTATAQLLRSE